MSIKTNARAHDNKKKLAAISLLLVVIALATVLLQTQGLINLFGKHTQPGTANSYTKGQQSQNSQKPTTDSGGSGSNSGEPSGNQKSPVSTALLAPYGNFVSDHNPNLSGTPHPNLMNSTCSTVPGATCQITFTKDGITKSLAIETTDAGGSAYWSWKLQDIGLTSGSWQVQAIARLGNQTKTTTDALLLKISP